MGKRIRDRPEIPDHEVYRQIGGGSYGEVWLAKSVTGAMRAVKVVWRDDFDDERTFEREFEGILKFEPISRDHPGLVHILHVGRGEHDQVPFYYYVMELGDDIYNGTEISPAEYLARTLGTDLKEANGEPIDVQTCSKIGLRLSDALDHLHVGGLAHRDVKPSNIIFVDGKAKLADIGLVAARDQRTFVGTEGFVPPEGPGSAQADVYSLGKVLYEMSSGKDRLDFPDPPSKPIPADQRKAWLQLNQVICDVCNPTLSKRKIGSAEELSESLERIHDGKTAKEKGRIHFASTAGFICLVVLLVLQLIPLKPIIVNAPPSNPISGNQPPKEPEMGHIKILSTPLGADVFDEEQNFLGTTPLPIRQEIVGSRIFFKFQAEGFKTQTWEGLVPADEPIVINPFLKHFDPPVPGQGWIDWLNNSYSPLEKSHLSDGYLNHYSWERFLAQTKTPKNRYPFKKGVIEENNQRLPAVYITKIGAKAYARWLTQTSIRKGFLTEDDQIIAQIDLKHPYPQQPSPAPPTPAPNASSPSAAPVSQAPKPPELWAFHCEVSKIPYGSLVVQAIPNDGPSFIYIDGLMRGVTPFTLEKVRPGQLVIEIEREGYKRIKKSVRIGPFENKELNFKLEINQSVVFGKEWENSLKMPFVPLREDLMVCVWETRVSDYETFLKSSKQPTRPFKPSFTQNSNHPIVFVSRDDAQAFCKWLTEKEQQDERISENHLYRLPTDAEWSEMNGLDNEGFQWPSQRELIQNDTFPWGDQWPPEENTGNFADEKADVSSKRKIPNYIDGFPNTAPVGSFKPNKFGIYDLGGNVHEWVSDNYSARGNYGVARGSGWRSYQKENLYLVARSAVTPKYRNDIYGFRIVLAKTSPNADE